MNRNTLCIDGVEWVTFQFQCKCGFATSELPELWRHGTIEHDWPIEATFDHAEGPVLVKVEPEHLEKAFAAARAVSNGENADRLLTAYKAEVGRHALKPVDGFRMVERGPGRYGTCEGHPYPKDPNVETESSAGSQIVACGAMTRVPGIFEPVTCNLTRHDPSTPHRGYAAQIDNVVFWGDGYVSHHGAKVVSTPNIEPDPRD